MRVIAMNVRTLNGKSEFVQCLMVTCPMGVALDNCPVKVIRTFPLNKRMEIVRRMPSSQLDAIIAGHRKCLELRAQIHREKQGRYAMSA